MSSILSRLFVLFLYPTSFRLHLLRFVLLVASSSSSSSSSSVSHFRLRLLFFTFRLRYFFVFTFFVDVCSFFLILSFILRLLRFCFIFFDFYGFNLLVLRPLGN
jgi:hypothetical protein